MGARPAKNVIRLVPPDDRTQISPAKVLRAAAKESTLRDVVVIARHDDGTVDFRSSSGDVCFILMLLALAQQDATDWFRKGKME